MKNSRFVIFVYCFLIATACIYVPWTKRLPSPNSRLTLSLGYSPIWQPIDTFATVDTKRIILELIAITAIFTIFFVLILKRK